MPSYALATWEPAGTTPGGTIVPRVIILHVTDGIGDARPHDGLEWHFEVRLDGSVQQQVDTTRRADANYHANGFAISIETEGLAAGEWTPEQMDSLVALCRWLLDVHPTIARQRCDRWDGSGIGHHTMWGAPSHWTPVAKSCPGARRKAQFDAELLPRILQGDDDMDLTQANLDSIEKVVIEALNKRGVSGSNSRDAALAADHQAIIGEIRKVPGWVALQGVDVDEEALAAALAPLVTSSLLGRLSDEDVDRIADAVADEQARRQVD